MKIVATYNIKGGVGKTAAAVNLSFLAARQGLRVLVWDLDPQGAATFYFRVKPKVKGGVQELINGKRELAGAIKGTDFENLDVIPADFSYRHLDIDLDQNKKPTKRIKRLLDTVKEEYDLVIRDCPPSISLVSESVFCAADALIVPVIPTILSVRTLQQLSHFMVKEKLNNLRLLNFFSLVDRRKKMHREIMEELNATRADILKAYIPYSSEVEKMGIHMSPVGATSSRSSLALKAYQALWEEVRDQMFGEK
jgi:chromosome partitioning protein